MPPELPARLSVAIVAICSEKHLLRCLESLMTQRSAPEFDVVVAAAPRLGALRAVSNRFPSVRLLDATGLETPIELAAIAVAECSGGIVLLTEDHCAADPDWVATLSNSVAANQRTVGGSLVPLPELAGFDWAFYFVDFHRYVLPAERGKVTSVSVCNVGYRRADLLQLDCDWRHGFHETRVHDELMRRSGDHLFEPDARMITGRMVGYRDGHRERYSFGRMFAAGRIDRGNRLRRALYGLGTAALPALLLIRLGSHAFRRRTTTTPFLRSLPHIATLVLAWTWGEFLGYITGSEPRDRDAAAERRQD